MHMAWGFPFLHFMSVYTLCVSIGIRTLIFWSQKLIMLPGRDEVDDHP